MDHIPENTNGLCAGIQRGDKFNIRGEADDATHFFGAGSEVSITGFGINQPHQCDNGEAKLLKFKDHDPSQWHPLWIIDCSKCPFYNLERTESCDNLCTSDLERTESSYDSVPPKGL